MEENLLRLTSSWTNFIRLHLLQLRRPRERIWMRPMLLERNENASNLLSSILEEELDTTIINFMRMSRADFNYLLLLVTPMIQKQDTNMRKAITAKDKLIITLRFLASGDDYKSLEYAYRVSEQSISKFIGEVCSCLIIVLRRYVKLPSTTEEWLRVSKGFEDKWDFPHAIGAMDGKHVGITSPHNTGTDNYNYKDFFSVVLLAVVDANYNFLYANVGAKGRISDGGVLRSTTLYYMLERRMLNIPAPQPLNDSSHINIPYMLLGDKAFAFTNYCIRPFGGITARGSKERIFNERHSRARRPVEMAFGILSARFRVLRKPMKLEPPVVRKIVLATVYLHNFIRRHQETEQALVNAESSDPSNNMAELAGNTVRPNLRLLQIRQHLAEYFVNNPR